MNVNVDQLFDEMMKAGSGAFAENWGEISTYAESEFRKMAQQVTDIADNVAKHQKDPSQGYDAQAGKILMDMQRKSTANVLVAMSAMTLATAEQSINAMLDVVNKAVGGAISAIL